MPKPGETIREAMPSTPHHTGGPLAAMSACYALGAFNDNFFKQAGLLLAASAHLAGVQGVATLLFALPFVVCSAWTGWLADLLPKKSIVIWCKVTEFAAMCLGLWSLYVLSWPGLILVVFLMGLQSAFFSPAINGAIPEYFSTGSVPKVNAIFKVATTASILLGIAMAGFFLDIPFPALTTGFMPSGEYGAGRLAIGLVTVLVSGLGLFAALGLRGQTTKRYKAAPFPWLGPVHSIRHALEARRQDRELFLCLMGEAFFYFLSSFVLLCITNLGKVQLGLSMTATGLLSLALMTGLGLGSLLSGRWQVAGWRRYVSASGSMMCLGLAASALCVSLPGGIRYPVLLCALTFTGICGGLYLIPIASFIQVRPAEHEKGKILGISNFSCFTGVMISGPLFSFLLASPLNAPTDVRTLLAFQFSPAVLLGAAGLLGLLFQIRLGRQLARLPGSLVGLRPGVFGMFLRLTLALRYKVNETGLDAIAWDPARKDAILFLPNHPALIDPPIVYSRLAGVKPRPLADAGFMSGFWGRMLSALLHTVLIPDLGKAKSTEARSEVEEGLARIIEALRQGDSVLMYPAGRIYRSNREVLGGNSGAWRVIQAVPGLRVVVVRNTGLWGSSFGYGADGKSPDLNTVVARGGLALLANALFFIPRRKVEVEFVEARDLPRQGDKKTLNTWLENFYNREAPPPMGVPHFFWQGSKPFALPTGNTDIGHDSARADIDPGVRDKVYAILRQAAGLDSARSPHPLGDSMLLNADLDLDSLAMMDVILKLEEIFGVSISQPERLLSVGDSLLAASGQLEQVEQEERKVPDSWFKPTLSADLALGGRGDTIADAFLAQVRAAPHEAMGAEWTGVGDRLRLLTLALILARRLRKYPGGRVGIMLPAAAAAPGVWLAAMLAGKEAVLLNWTGGEVNLRHCITVSGVRHVLSSTMLLERLKRQGLDLAALPVTWVELEKLSASIGLPEKLRGAVKARLTRSLAGYSVPKTAAILFTSGSETMPKGVPLTHANLLTNATDLIRVLGLRPGVNLAATLPTFHSFGLIADMVIPLAFGVRAAYYPNPTDPAAVASLIRDFGLSVLPTTPTFLQAVLDRARGTDKVDSLRYVFVGAEKCPAKVYRDFAEQCPKAVFCEGYGVTECSPVISVNRPGDARQGSLGQPLPSVTAVVVREENGLARRILGSVQQGETGMLLVRGPSVFSGYLGDVASPFVEYAEQSWYRTGDLVSMDDGGRLVFKGRLTRFVKIGGEMVSLPQIEDVLLETFGNRPDAPGKAVALAVEAGPGERGEQEDIVLFTPMDLNLDEVNSAIRQAGLGALHRVRRIVRMDVPLLGSGKTDYRGLKRGLTAPGKVEP